MKTLITNTTTVMTGDRPTGPLHLGHYVGSLKERVRLQNDGHHCFVMIADMQAYTDNANNTQKIREAIPEVMADYIATGIDPDRTTIFLQSAVPELAELTMLYMNLVSVSRLERNPTIRDEIRLRGFERDIPSGFLCYPVSQAADITAFKATHIPVGNDQLPMIELAKEVARRINYRAGKEIIPEPLPVLSKISRLPGIDGKAKASKSLGNAIFLSDTTDQVRDKVMLMFTDPDHIRISDPGKVEGNVVFSYLDAFDSDLDEVSRLKNQYRSGGLGDVMLKRRLIAILEDELHPMRSIRADALRDISKLQNILLRGNEKARNLAASTLDEVKEALGVYVL